MFPWDSILSTDYGSECSDPHITNLSGLSVFLPSKPKEYTLGAIVTLPWIYDPWTQKNDSHWGWLWQLAAALFYDDLWFRPEGDFEDQKDHSHWALEMVKMSLEAHSFCRQTGPFGILAGSRLAPVLKAINIFKKNENNTGAGVGARYRLQCLWIAFLSWFRWRTMLRWGAAQRNNRRRLVLSEYSNLLRLPGNS